MRKSCSSQKIFSKNDDFKIVCCIFSDISEFCNPCIVALGHLSLQNATIIDFEYIINIKVIDTNFNASEMFDVTRVTLACGMIGIPILIKGVKKRQKNSNALK